MRKIFLFGFLAFCTWSLTARAQDDYWEEHKNDPPLRVTKWINQRERAFGFSIKLPKLFAFTKTQKRPRNSGTLKVERNPGAVRIQNYEDDEIVGDGGLMPHQYYLTFQTEIDGDPFSEFKAICAGDSNPLPNVKGGFWCAIKPDDDGDSQTSHTAIFRTPKGLQTLDIAAGFAAQDIEALLNSIRLLDEKK